MRILLKGSCQNISADACQVRYYIKAAVIQRERDAWLGSQIILHSLPFQEIQSLEHPSVANSNNADEFVLSESEPETHASDILR